MTAHRFELVGAHPVLDFVNTVSEWTGYPTERRDYLSEPADAIRLGRAIGLLSPAEAGRLSEARSAGAELRRLRDLRARLERILRAVASGSPVSEGDLEAMARAAGAAAGAARLRAAPKGRVIRAVEEGAAGSALLRHRLADQAVGLLTSDAIARLKSCPGCGWFFLDLSKNRSRRWCSMATCGSCAKSRSYYRRHKSAGSL